MLRKFSRISARNFTRSIGLLCNHNRTMIPSTLCVTQMSNEEMKFVEDFGVKEVLSMNYVLGSVLLADSALVGPFSKINPVLKEHFLIPAINEIKQIDEEGAEQKAPSAKKRGPLFSKSSRALMSQERKDQLIGQEIMPTYSLQPKFYVDNLRKTFFNKAIDNLKEMIEDREMVYASSCQVDFATKLMSDRSTNLAFLESKSAVVIEEVAEADDEVIDQFLGKEKKKETPETAEVTPQEGEQASGDASKIPETSERNKNFKSRLEELGWRLVAYSPTKDALTLVNELSEPVYQKFCANLIEFEEIINGFAKTNSIFSPIYIDHANLVNDRATALEAWNTILGCLMGKSVLEFREINVMLMIQCIAVQSEFALKIFKQFNFTYRNKMDSLIQEENLTKASKSVREDIMSRVEKIIRANQVEDHSNNNNKKELESKVKEVLAVVKPEVANHLKEELDRFMNSNSHDSEGQILRTYLEFVIKLPLGKFTPDSTDIKKAEDILESSHYGMEEVKKRFYELLSVRILKGEFVSNKIICLLGPPGVGKTSIVRDVARSLGREYVRISLGGENDPSSLRGHRKGYVSAYAGKIAQALKTAKSMNPVILLDEIDKLGTHNHRGNPQETLLEILDPSQNQSFVDQYLEFPIDLSKVIFVCSANVLNNKTMIPPLLDRMEVIDIAGYTTLEKVTIFQKHIKNKKVTETGLSNYKINVDIPDQLVERIITEYARDPGVRSLERLSSLILEKVCYELDKTTDISKYKIEDVPAKKEKEENEEKPASEAKSDDSATANSTSADSTVVETPEASTQPTPESSEASTSSPVSENAQVKIPEENSSKPKPDDNYKRLFDISEEDGRLKVRIPEENLVKLIGVKLYSRDIEKMEPEELIGFSQGMAYNGYGGSVLPIEVTRVPSKNPGLKIITEDTKDEKEKDHDKSNEDSSSLAMTGSLGKVIKESVEIAFTFAKQYLRSRYNNTSLEKDQIHVHWPEAGVKKDGPSAGAAITTAFITLALKRPYDQRFAMTGEISLNGYVMKIGGVKEKTLGAKREGITKLIFPYDNKNDVEELSDELKEGMEFFFAKKYDDVAALIFPETNN